MASPAQVIEKYRKYEKYSGGGVIEAVASEVFRYIDLNLVPVTNLSKVLDRVAIESQFIDNFKDARTLGQDDHALSPFDETTLKASPKSLKQLAMLSVVAYILQENDFNPENWGINKLGDFIKIDHDQCFLPVSAKHCDQLNLCYTDNISEIAKEIEDFPKLSASYPFNWIMSQTDIRLRFLIQDPVFIEYKFYTFTKAILLYESLIKSLIEIHIVNEDPKDHKMAEDIQAFLLQRLDVIKRALVQMPEYKKVISEKYKQWLQDVEREVLEYNSQPDCKVAIDFKIIKNNFEILSCECLQSVRINKTAESHTSFEDSTLTHSTYNAHNDSVVRKALTPLRANTTNQKIFKEDSKLSDYCEQVARATATITTSAVGYRARKALVFS